MCGKKWWSLILCLAIITLFSACDSDDTKNETDNGKIKVSVTFNALKEFVEAVGKEKVQITTIIPDGTEPHDFEPKAQDLINLNSADVFVYNGFGMETWVGDAVKSADNTNLIVVEASKGATPIKNTDASDVKTHGQYDPHLWLSLKGAQIEVKNIETALIQADPTNKSYYQKNAHDFTAQLEAIYNDYANKFKPVNKKSFVTGHAAFAYLCRDFGLTQNSVEDVFAEGEPSAKQLTTLINYCKLNKVTTIFAEKISSPAISETLANEVGANVETIYTIESSEDNMTYLERMKDNMSKIYSSLKK